MVQGRGPVSDEHERARQREFEMELAGLCEDCRRRPGLSKILRRAHFERTGQARYLRLCDICVRARMAQGDPDVGGR